VSRAGYSVERKIPGLRDREFSGTLHCRLPEFTVRVLARLASIRVAADCAEIALDDARWMLAGTRNANACAIDIKSHSGRSRKII